MTLQWIWKLFPRSPWEGNSRKRHCIIHITGDEMDTDHFDFNDIFKDLPELRTFCVTYGVRDCGMNFEWNLFQFTTRDCLQLSKCIATTKHLTSFSITRSKVRNKDDEWEMFVTWPLVSRNWIIEALYWSRPEHQRSVFCLDHYSRIRHVTWVSW